MPLRRQPSFGNSDSLVRMFALFPCYQRSLIYRPIRAKISPADAMLSPGRVHEIAVQTADGLTLKGWHILPKGRAARDAQGCNREPAIGRPLVLYFPGNSGHRLFRRDEFELLSSLNVDIFAFDYRGYGDNPGRPGESEIACDAQAIWNYATTVRGVPFEQILLYGESLGGAVATRLAADCCDSRMPPRGLIVRSTFSTLADVGAHWFPYLPVRWFVLEDYPSQARIEKVTCPLLQLHGLFDDVIPPALGRALFAQAPPQSYNGIAKQFVSLPHANHDNAVFVDRQRWHDALRTFLGRISAAERASLARPHFFTSGFSARDGSVGLGDASLGKGR